MSVPIETAVGETPSAKGSFGFRFMAPLCLGSMLNPVNSTMISPALVATGRDFQATVAETGLLIGGLYITSAIAQPTMGRLADRLGRAVCSSPVSISLPWLAWREHSRPVFAH